jgi:hypothetical protein
MFTECGGILLTIGPQHQVRLNPQRAHRKAAVAIVAVLLIVAAIAVLRVVLGLYRVYADKVAAVALGLIVVPKVTFGKVRAVAATLMAIKAPDLLMTLVTVIACLTGQDTMSAHEICIMVGCDALGLVAGVAFSYFHLRIVCM